MQVLVTMVQNLLALASKKCAALPYTAALFAYPLIPCLFCTLYYKFHKTDSLCKIDMHLRQSRDILKINSIYLEHFLSVGVHTQGNNNIVIYDSMKM